MVRGDGGGNNGVVLPGDVGRARPKRPRRGPTVRFTRSCHVACRAGRRRLLHDVFVPPKKPRRAHDHDDHDDDDGDDATAVVAPSPLCVSPASVAAAVAAVRAEIIYAFRVNGRPNTTTTSASFPPAPRFTRNAYIYNIIL